MDRPLRKFTKYTGETLTYAIDWSDLLDNENDAAGDTISVSTWSITPSGNASDMIVSGSASIDSGNTRTLVTLTAGRELQYTVTNTVTLATNGNIVVYKFLVEVIG